MKKHKAMRTHKNNKAPETRKMWKIPPPWQITDLSVSAEGMKVAVGLLVPIRYQICCLLSKGINLITVPGCRGLKYPNPPRGQIP